MLAESQHQVPACLLPESRTRASESPSLSLWAFLYLGNEDDNTLKIVEGINWDNSKCSFPFPLLISYKHFKRKKIEVSWFSRFHALRTMPLYHVPLASCDPRTEDYCRIISHQLGRLDFEMFSKTINRLPKLGMCRPNFVFCKQGCWRLNRIWEDCLS